MARPAAGAGKAERGGARCDRFAIAAGAVQRGCLPWYTQRSPAAVSFRGTQLLRATATIASLQQRTKAAARVHTMISRGAWTLGLVDCYAPQMVFV